MSHVVLISDNTFFGPTGVSRYIGPYALANSLENRGVSTCIIDYCTQTQDFFSILESNLSSDTAIVGISSTFLSSPVTKELISSPTFSWDSASNYLISPPLSDTPIHFDQWLKDIRSLLVKKSSKAKIIVGGSKVQSIFNYPLPLFQEIDFIVWGPVDQVFFDIYQDLINTGDIKYFNFNGRKIADTVHAYRQGKVCPSMSWRSHWQIQEGEALPIEISRGCRFNCKFCHYDKQESFQKSLEGLRAELVANYENFGTRYYHFCDDCFNDHPNKVEAVCGLILSLPFKIEWVSYVRVDVAVRFPETAELMVKSGARGLFWGLESFNAIAARKAGKGTSPEEVKKFLKTFYSRYHETCTSLGSFIVGLPGETVQTQRETISWVVNEGALHFINVGPLRVAPYKQLFDRNVLDYADYSRNPQKYGFEYIRFNEDGKNQLSEDWKHETMNFNEALDLTDEFVTLWKRSDSRRRGLVPTMWSFPHLRSLGYSHDEVFDIHFSEEKFVYYLNDASNRFSARLNRYFTKLRK